MRARFGKREVGLSLHEEENKHTFGDVRTKAPKSTVFNSHMRRFSEFRRIHFCVGTWKAFDFYIPDIAMIMIFTDTI